MSSRTVVSLFNCDLIGVGNKERTLKALPKGGAALRSYLLLGSIFECLLNQHIELFMGYPK